MAVLPRFATPAGIPDANAGAWHNRVRDIFATFTGDFPQFYDPTADDTPDDALTVPIAWSAFPATLLVGATSQEGRWGIADTSPERRAQDEYCEWRVDRDDAGTLIGVTFTTELPEYWEHLAEHDRSGLLDLYHRFVDPAVKEDDLFDAAGNYDRTNIWNTGRGLAHLAQASNSLHAAVALVAQATVLRERGGQPVTGKQDLVDCADLGEPLRNSDPQIAAAVNAAAASGAAITFADPVGLYIRSLALTGIEAPDGEDPAAFWTTERGDAERILRARFAVEGKPYVAGDLKVGGRPLNFGAQLADRVEVAITAVSKSADHEPQTKPCEP